MDTLKVLNEILTQLKVQGENIKSIQNDFWATFWTTTGATAIGALLAGLSAWLLFYLQAESENKKNIENEKKLKEDKIKNIVAEAHYYKNVIYQNVGTLNNANLMQRYYNCLYLISTTEELKVFNKKLLDLYHDRYNESLAILTEQMSKFGKLCHEFSITKEEKIVLKEFHELDNLPNLIPLDDSVLNTRFSNEEETKQVTITDEHEKFKYLQEVYLTKLEILYGMMLNNTHIIIDLTVLRKRIETNLNKPIYSTLKDLYNKNKSESIVEFL